jgi:membrane protein required for colicin V production|tara:strand:- start:126 stop:674 length:549 start_codon:yes stop_codon:yes gene_type:complete
MIEDFIDYFLNSLNIFDIIFFVIMIYSIIQCFLKGFSLSFISFLKWILSIIMTIIFVPKFQPWVSEYIESPFVNSVGLGMLIFILSLFIMIIIGKALGRAITWTGLGSIDKSFGIIFGIFKGYIVTVCLFSILNWFYPYQNWDISAENALSFDIVKKGSEILVEEFPNSDEFIDTKEKIEKI